MAHKGLLEFESKSDDLNHPKLFLKGTKVEPCAFTCSLHIQKYNSDQNSYSKILIKFSLKNKNTIDTP